MRVIRELGGADGADGAHPARRQLRYRYDGVRESHAVVRVRYGHVLSPHLGAATRGHGHAEPSHAGLLLRKIRFDSIRFDSIRFDSTVRYRYDGVYLVLRLDDAEAPGGEAGGFLLLRVQGQPALPTALANSARGTRKRESEGIHTPSP